MAQGRRHIERRRLQPVVAEPGMAALDQRDDAGLVERQMLGDATRQNRPCKR